MLTRGTKGRAAARAEVKIKGGKKKKKKGEGVKPGREREGDVEVGVVEHAPPWLSWLYHPSFNQINI